VLAGAAVTLLGGCSYAVGDGTGPQSAANAADHDAHELPVDDTSRCEFKGRDDREVAESVGTGALQPSIRRVYRLVGQGSDRRRVIVCREVDTNLDGKKDVVRRYNDQGQPIEERADTDYDVLDRSSRFSRGKITLIEIDRNQDDKPEETRYYQNGKLSRVQRDTNADGKPDIWEIYAGGHLERMGVDVDFDGRVDRWNRDEVTLRAQRAADAEPGKDAEPNSHAEPRSHAEPGKDAEPNSHAEPRSHAEPGKDAEPSNHPQPGAAPAQGNRAAVRAPSKSAAERRSRDQTKRAPTE
jgi:hypothetical protein